MDDLARGFKSDYDAQHEAELARLTLILVTPKPTGSSATSDRHAAFGTIAKDVLLVTLQAIVQSSDAFPPLKSAASGLLFFAIYADMASSNKQQIRDVYKHIHGLAASLERGSKSDSPATPEHQEIVRALAADVESLNGDLEDIITERKSRFKRFFAAKRHQKELENVVMQLESAKMNYMTAMATLNAMTVTEVRGDVRAIMLALGIRPPVLKGARCLS
ncbi:unnamed protein product [Peniophora sp. CBMAI 1063]|nr:unnamed protein product [Peniophora sp. CBMAI 1063]